jgi:hypothetical protein
MLSVYVDFPFALLKKAIDVFDVYSKIDFKYYDDCIEAGFGAPITLSF